MNTSIPGTDSDLQVREGPNLKNNIFLSLVGSSMGSPIELQFGLDRAVIKSWGPRIFPSYYGRGPQLLAKENRRKIEPKEILSYFIPRLLVVFTRQLEILVTSPL